MLPYFSRRMGSQGPVRQSACRVARRTGDLCAPHSPTGFKGRLSPRHDWWAADEHATPVGAAKCADWRALGSVPSPGRAAGRAARLREPRRGMMQPRALHRDHMVGRMAELLFQPLRRAVGADGEHRRAPLARLGLEGADAVFGVQIGMLRRGVGIVARAVQEMRQRALLRTSHASPSQCSLASSSLGFRVECVSSLT